MEDEWLIAAREGTIRAERGRLGKKEKRKVYINQRSTRHKNPNDERVYAEERREQGG